MADLNDETELLREDALEVRGDASGVLPGDFALEPLDLSELVSFFRHRPTDRPTTDRPTTKNHLRVVLRWLKDLTICCFVGCGVLKNSFLKIFGVKFDATASIFFLNDAPRFCASVGVHARAVAWNLTPKMTKKLFL